MNETNTSGAKATDMNYYHKGETYTDSDHFIGLQSNSMRMCVWGLCPLFTV